MEDKKSYTKEDMQEMYEAGRKIGKGEDHNLYASKETLQKFCEVNQKIDGNSKLTEEIHSAIFGVDNVGGLVKTIDRIEAQTIKTNGNVRALQIWKSCIIGGITVIVGVVIPLITFIYFEKVNQLNEKIEASLITIKK